MIYQNKMYKKFFLKYLVMVMLFITFDYDCKLITCKIIKSREYKTFYSFKAIKEKDTIYIISYKDYYGGHKTQNNNIREIKINEEYNFYLTPEIIRTSKMEQLGAFIIIDEDTLWKASNYKEIPKFYIANNTIGHYIFEK